MDYQYGNKKQWRRWQWNRIVERAADRRNSLVLFLAGETAPDVDAAVAKGFRAENMIAVERDQSTLKALRSRGVLAIDGDLCDVLLAWNERLPVGVVVADFCCGLEKRLIDVLGIAQMTPALTDAVFAVNFLRGRDKSSGEFRGLYDGRHGVSTKHRGVIFHDAIMAKQVVMTIPTATDVHDALTEELRELSSPEFTSYRSTAGAQVFDSCVCRSPWRQMTDRYGLPPPLVRERVPSWLLPQRRRNSAILAHRTRATYQNSA